MQKQTLLPSLRSENGEHRSFMCMMVCMSECISSVHVSSKGHACDYSANYYLFCNPVST